MSHSDPAPSRHAPRVGPLRRILGPLHFTGSFWYRAALFGARVVPDWLMGPIVALFTTLFYLCLGSVRKAIARNARVRGIEHVRARDVFRVLRNFAWCLVERYEQFAPGKTFENTIENLDVWRERMEASSGFVMVTAHLGNWELGSTLPTAKSGLELHLVREPEMNAESQAFAESLLHDLGGPRYVTHFARGDMELGLELLRALEAGHIVALQGDRPRAAGQVVRADLFGQAVAFPVGVATIARIADVPMVPVFIIRNGRRSYRVVLRDPIRVARTRDRAKDVREATEAFARQLEWAIQEAPSQWFSFGEIEADALQSTAADGSPERPVRRRRPLWVRVGSVLSGVAFVGYPLAVYFGAGRGSTRFIGAALLALGAFRLVLLRFGAGEAASSPAPDLAEPTGSTASTLFTESTGPTEASADASLESQRLSRWMVTLGAAALVLLALWAVIVDDEAALVYVPALWSAAGSAAFFASLVYGRESWVERVARATHGVDELPPIARRYCRRVTALWGSFLFLNALVCAGLGAFGPLGAWALYSGVIGYALVAVLMGAEYVYRITRVKPRADLEAEALGLSRASS